MKNRLSRRRFIRIATLGLGGITAGCAGQSDGGKNISTPLGFSNNSTNPTTVRRNSSRSTVESDSENTQNISTSETKTIPVLKSGDRVIRSANVSSKWLSYMKKVKKVNREVQRKYQDTPGVRTIGMGDSEKMIDGNQVSKVVVGAKSDKLNSVRKIIPNQVDGVTVDVKSVDKINPV